jgi:alpha-N-arabinofuranosidase
MTALLLLAAVLPVSSCGRAQGPLEASISIDAGKEIGEVPKFILGQNTEAGDAYHIFGNEHTYGVTRTGSGIWDPVAGKPEPKMLTAARETGMAILRFPGGCLTHNYNWKDAICPVASRANFAFGIDEFIAFCKAAGCEPLMTVADYLGGPQDAADLVEYLNAPADSAHPWAMKRAADGHREPYKVTYFEMGNESDHGNHDVVPHKQFSPERYAQWVNDSAALMRKVDPSIKIGALTATTFPKWDTPWNAVVLPAVKSSIDFVVVHTYSVQVVSADRPVETPADKLMRAAMASGEQFEAYLADYRALVARLCGKALPLAITEYNAMFVQEQPIQYRFSLGAALFSADYLRVLMQPQSNVLMANYWQFANGYWGFARTDGGAFKTLPAYYLFRLWAQHFGSRLVSAETESPGVEFEGGVGIVAPAHGSEKLKESVSTQDLMDGVQLQSSSQGGVTTSVAGDGTAVADISNQSADAHIALAIVPGRRGGLYRVSFEARSSASLGGATLGLSVIDARGWEPYHSGMAVEGAEGAHEWRSFEGRFQSLDDAMAVVLAWRILPHGTAVSGKLEIRNLRVSLVRQASFAAYRAVTSCASLSRDGRKLYFVVFNKHSERAAGVIVRLSGFAAVSARRWTVTGPRLEATNLGSEEVRETVSGEAVPVTGGVLRLTLPPRSMTAVEVEK